MTTASRPERPDDADADAFASLPAEDATAAKRARRRELLSVRRSLTAAEVAGASQRIVTHLLGLPEVQRARTLLLYAADPDEVDLGAMLDDPPVGCTVLLPRVEADTLVAVRHTPGADLVVGQLGVREPVGPPVDPTGIDVVIVPGVAFDVSGGRLGRGRGLYDRFLPLLVGAVRIGVCVERFMMADLPLEAHDIRMDVVVTDASVRRRDAVDSHEPA